MRGEDIPASCKTVYDQMAFLSLRTIYRNFRDKRIERPAATAEKRKVLAVWDKAKRTAEFERKLAAYQARLHKDAERAATAVRKDPSPENAIMLCDVLDGLAQYRPGVDGGDSE